GCAGPYGWRPGGFDGERRAMEGKRRLRPLVVVGRFTAETIAAAAGCEVVERPAEPVATEKPLERVPCAPGMLGVAGDLEGGELGFDQCGGVERLLVAGAWCRVAAVAALMTGEAERAVGQPGLVAEPARRPG